MDNRHTDRPAAGAAGPTRDTIRNMNWRVGVLRPGAENIMWAASGDADDWRSARRLAIGALHELVRQERRRQEYRIQVGDVAVIVWPGLNHGPDHDGGGRLDLSGVDYVLPRDRDAAAAFW